MGNFRKKAFFIFYYSIIYYYYLVVFFLLCPSLFDFTLFSFLLPWDRSVSLPFLVNAQQPNYFLRVVAGNGTLGYNGDNRPSTSALLSFYDDTLGAAGGIYGDVTGELYVGDTGNFRLRKVDLQGIITTKAGTGTFAATGVNGAGTSVNIGYPWFITGDTLGSFLYFNDNYFIWKCQISNGFLTRYAGAVPALYSYGGDGEQATAALFYSIRGLSLSTMGLLYVGDRENNRIRVIAIDGIVTTFAGSGPNGGAGSYGGDGGQAASTNCKLNRPSGVYADTVGNVFFVDYGNGRVRKVDSSGIIRTFAGGGAGGEGVQATSATLSVNNVRDVKGDRFGNIYIAENCKIRMVNLAGIINRVAGTASSCITTLSFSAATTSPLKTVYALWVNSISEVFFAEEPGLIHKTVNVVYPTSQPSCCPSSQPSKQPLSRPSSRPTMQPTSSPSSQPSAHPTVEPTTYPSSQPSASPSNLPSSFPSNRPTSCPISLPSSQPSSQPSHRLTTQPSSYPSSRPSAYPSNQPSAIPSSQPTRRPLSRPSSRPSSLPSCCPTMQPSCFPSSQPSSQPSIHPSSKPSHHPTLLPTCCPSTRPSSHPSSQPSREPTTQPSDHPSSQPSRDPTTQPSNHPSSQPSNHPSSQPSNHPSSQPSREPTTQPSDHPSSQPSNHPSSQPSNRPSSQPSRDPTTQPSDHPSSQPSNHPSSQPSREPTTQPSDHPSSQPSNHPSSQPSREPTTQPSNHPSSQPSNRPSSQPSRDPTTQPSNHPSSQPSNHPSSQPSNHPSSQPSREPTTQPSDHPSSQPSREPTTRPSDYPSSQPSRDPTTQPSNRPSSQPSHYPTTNSPTTSFPSTHPSSDPSSQSDSFPSVQPTHKIDVYLPSSLPTSTVSSYQFLLNTQHQNLYLQVVAGTGTNGYNGDNQSATLAQLNFNLNGGAVYGDSNGVLFVGEAGNSRLRKIDLKGIIRTIVGTGTSGSSGASGLGTVIALKYPRYITCDTMGSSIYFSDYFYIWKFQFSNGFLSRYAGAVPQSNGFNGDGQQATTAVLFGPLGVSLSTMGLLYFADQRNNRVRVVAISGIITTFAGSGPTGIGVGSYGGDGGPATSTNCKMYDPYGVYADTIGNVLIAEQGSSRIRIVDSSGIIRTFAGGGGGGDGVQATSALLTASVNDVQGDRFGNIYIADNCKIRMVNLAGIISTIAGTGICGTTMTFSSATSSPINKVYSLWINSNVDVYFAEKTPGLIRKLVSVPFPTSQPSQHPSSHPSLLPLSQPSFCPYGQPSCDPSHPTSQPSTRQTELPSSRPSSQPTYYPTAKPFSQPSIGPSSRPSSASSNSPSSPPSGQPSVNPSNSPSSQPKNQPSVLPSTQPSHRASDLPSSLPSTQPFSRPSSHPSSSPSSRPSHYPTAGPSLRLSSEPSFHPSNQLSYLPSTYPTSIPSHQPYSKPSSSPVQPTSYPTRGTKAPVINASALPVLSVLPTSTSRLFFHQMNFLFGAGISSFSSFRNIILSRSPLILSKSYIVLGLKSTFPTEFNLSLSNHLQLTPLHVSSLSVDSLGTRAISFGGDFNHDGLPELLIGSPLSSTVYIIYSSRSNREWSNVTDYSVLTGKKETSNGLGWAISSAGDFNKDGIEDIVISAIYSNKVYVLKGKPSLNVIQQTDIEAYLTTDQNGWILSIRKDPLILSLGVAVSFLKDYNGDNFDDIVISAVGNNGANRIFIVLGGSSVSSSIIYLNDLSSFSTSRVLTIIAPTFSFAGLCLSGVGDVNGDGLGDLLIGSLPYNKGYSSQQSYLLYGSRSPSKHIFLSNFTEEGKGSLIKGGGFIVSGIGDINSDGYDDMMITSFNDWQGKIGSSYMMLLPNKQQWISNIPSFLPSSSPSFVITASPTSSPSKGICCPTSLPTFISQVPTSVPSFKNTSTSSRAPTFLTTLKPSRFPTFLGSVIPTVVPTVKPSRFPSFSPTQTCSPSLIPTASPTTRLPTKKPSFKPSSSSDPSFFPTSHPSLSASSQGRTVEITSGGFFEIGNGEENLVVSSKKDVTIKGNQGKKRFIFSRNLANNVTITILEFNSEGDVLDFSQFATSSSSSFSYSYSTNPLTFFVASSPPTLSIRIILLSHSDYDLQDDNIILPSSSLFSSSSSSSSLSFESLQISSDFLSVVIPLFGILAIFATLMRYHRSRYYIKKKQQEEAEEKWRENADLVVDDDKFIDDLSITDNPEEMDEIDVDNSYNSSLLNEQFSHDSDDYDYDEDEHSNRGYFNNEITHEEDEVNDDDGIGSNIDEFSDDLPSFDAQTDDDHLLDEELLLQLLVEERQGR
jgi:hypothetical protein